MSLSPTRSLPAGPLPRFLQVTTLACSVLGGPGATCVLTQGQRAEVLFPLHCGCMWENFLVFV